MRPEDLFLLLLRGVIVASFPLAFVWAARGEDRLRRLAWITVFFTFDLIIFGGFTRLTDSGLGCPDWPGCFAKANPLAAATDIHAAQALFPAGPVTMTKAWIEMIHRFLAMGVGCLILVLTIGSWRQRARPGRSPWIASLALILVCVQGAFGAWTVTRRLEPVIVTTHLLLALGLLSLLTWHAMRFERGDPAPPGLGRRVPGLRFLAGLAGLLLAVQVALGGWVSTNYAVLACTDFPLCQGHWIPEMDFRHGFELWRQLGRTAAGTYLPLAALTAIHWVHRTFAFVVFLVLAVLVARTLREPALKSHIRWVTLVAIAQLLTGLANVLFGWPLAAAVLHNAGAAALVLLLVMVNYRIAQPTRRPPSDHPTASPEV